MKTIIILCMNVLLGLTALAANGPVGFVNVYDLGQFGITGGAAGKIVHVSNRADFDKFAGSSAPCVIVVDNDLTGGGVNDLQDEVSVGSNKTIIGSGSGKKLNGICLNIVGQKNIIIRNIILTKGRTDGLSFRNCHHVWIDHCDLSNSYDGLLDFTLGSDYMTVSWTKLHDHNKVSIVNSGTCHYEDYGKEHVTYAHCWFANNVQRNPRIGYGKAHVYNCYWTDISSYCIGVHSQGEVLSEYNYFTNTANTAFENQYSKTLPYCGYITDNGSILDGNSPKAASSYAYTGINYSPKEWYDFEFDQTGVSSVPNDIKNGVGPKADLEFEPILNPGNGAIGVTCDIQLSWQVASDRVENTKVYFGLDKDNLLETDARTLKMLPETTYYWKVVATVGGKEYSSPIYHFTTAKEAVSQPYPANGQIDPWLRTPSSQYEFCTDMPLKWHKGFDAKSYRVYLSESPTLESPATFETVETMLVPGRLTLGKTYYWRVDAVRADGSVATGETWSFSTPLMTVKSGKNELEKMYLSGITFTESNRTYSGGARTVGDQGPGAMVGIWNGEAGRYAINTAYYNETLGENTFGISINGKLVDKWYSSTASDGLAVHKTRRTQILNPGDEIRVEFIAGPKAAGIVSEARARMDYISFIANENEFVNTDRPSAQPHAPVITVTHDCEYLPLKNLLFKDTLGVVGEYGSYQITDDYCSWVSYTDKMGNTLNAVPVDKLKNPIVSMDKNMVFYVKEAELVKFNAVAGGKLTAYCQNIGTGATDTIAKADSVEIELDKLVAYRIVICTEEGETSLDLAKLYKVAPTDCIYHQPKKTGKYDYEFFWSTAMLFVDNEGRKGVAGKIQLEDEFSEWCRYYNPSANEVQAKNANNAVYYLDPTTDKACSRKSVPGGSGYCYIVGTEKSMTYHVQNCSKMKFYYTGSGGAATTLRLEVKDVSTGITTIVQGGEANGKAVASNSVETELDADKNYQVTIIADTGDMLVYATKLWRGNDILLGDANDDGIINVNDITATAEYILKGKAEPWNTTNADANEDGVINVNDITAIADIILHK